LIAISIDAKASKMSLPIPQPPGIPLLGNIYDVNPDDAVASLAYLAGKYGWHLNKPTQISDGC
jgi:hypothetical protein